MFDTLLYTITNFASGIYILVWKYHLVKKGKTVQCFTWVTVLKIILVSKLSYQVVKNGLNWWIENIWFTVYRYISQVNSGVMVEFITYWVTKLDRFFLSFYNWVSSKSFLALLDLQLHRWVLHVYLGWVEIFCYRNSFEDFYFVSNLENPPFSSGDDVLNRS